MRKTITFLICLLTLVSCNDSIDYTRYLDKGTLTFNELTVDVEPSKANAPTSVNYYTLYIVDKTGAVVTSMTYDKFVEEGKKITLLAGNYTLKVRSVPGDVPYAVFEDARYGLDKAFTINAQKETSLGSLVCKLLQCKVTVSYSAEFLSSVTGDGSTTVSIDGGHNLVYNLTYNGGNISFDTRAGYFYVAPGTSTTMEVTFKGNINGKDNKMVYKALSNIEACTFRKIEFVEKISEEGTADIVVTIEDIVMDEELRSDVQGEEEVLGPDPEAPKGDGGIKLVSTCSYDITETIVIPPVGEEFILTMQAIVPNKVNSFTVEIESTNSNFVDAVKLINDGSNVLDLVNPSAGAIEVFTTILPFPYGDQVKDKELIDFDLSAAQAPISIFKGTHTFIMRVTDHKGFKKEIYVDMQVN